MPAFIAKFVGALITLLTTFASVLLGGLITFAASYFFYYRASRQLKEETQKLLKPIRLVLEALEAEKIVEFTRNEKGEPVSITLKIHVKENIKVEDAEATIIG